MKTILYFFLPFAFFCVLLSCSKDEEVPQDEIPVNTPVKDYRDAFVGSYNCEKAGNKDFTFTTDIVVEVVIDSLSSNSMYINDILVPVDENGVYGPDYLDTNTNYYVRFTGNEIYIEVFGVIENGIIAPCFIRGSK